MNNFVKFKSEKRRFKNEKEEEVKNQLLFEKVKISEYWSENLNLSQFTLSKKLSKIFLGSTVMTKIFGPKEGEKRCFLAKITSKLLATTSDPKKFFKNFLTIDIAKDSG